MPIFEALWENGPIFAQAEHFKLGTDSVLLANFVKSPGAKKGIDLGCASGAISLLLLERMPKLHMTGLEIVPEAVELAKENMAANGFEERSHFVNG
ncbi:MAG: methyltransferase, partial [Oscillospiraceae bacterium]|nr:methyltransferase [Oscillospiraceae bacterium]